MSTDAALDDVHTHTDLNAAELQHLLRDGLVRVPLLPPRRAEYPGETPTEGAGAEARWVALYDRACELRAALRPGDGVGERQARRAIRSLFLYEHQLTPKTRRKARTLLWRRDRAEGLPAFAELARWARCRCARCQLMSATHAAGVADAVLRSA
jgi:phytoene dehydrogenase-like protein